MEERRSTLHRRDSRGRIISTSEPKNGGRRMKRGVSVGITALVLTLGVTGVLLGLTMRNNAANAARVNRLEVERTQLTTALTNATKAQVSVTEIKTEVTPKAEAEKAEPIILVTAPAENLEEGPKPEAKQVDAPEKKAEIKKTGEKVIEKSAGETKNEEIKLTLEPLEVDAPETKKAGEQVIEKPAGEIKEPVAELKPALETKQVDVAEAKKAGDKIIESAAETSAKEEAPSAK